MKRIDILILLELFNIRKRTSYPKQIIKDSYSVVRSLCYRKNLLLTEGINYYQSFVTEFRKIYLEKTPLEYSYCKEFLRYLSSFDMYIVDTY